MTVAATIGHRLSLEVFSFVIGIVAQPIKEGESLSCDRDGDLGPEFNIATSLAANNRPDVRLKETHDSIRDASAVCVIENGLLADQLTDDQQLLVDMPSGRQKAATTGDQGVNARQIPLQVAELLLDGLADFADTGPLLLGYS